MSKKVNDKIMEDYGTALWSYQSGRAIYKSVGDRALRSADPAYAQHAIKVLRKRLQIVYALRNVIIKTMGVALPSIRIPVYGNANKTWKGEQNGII